MRRGWWRRGLGAKAAGHRPHPGARDRVWKEQEEEIRGGFLEERMVEKKV